ncbi:MAG: hypothetical protein GY799_17370 [Desulfobulbaceae bacterium]|nr:hypothetical protein [Desulfobulbaceae bacterium]
MKIKAVLFLCLVVLVGCNGGGGGDDGGSAETKALSLPTEKSSSDFLEDGNATYSATLYSISTNEKTGSGVGEVWTKSHNELIDGVEREVTETLVDVVINGTSYTEYSKTYIITSGSHWYLYDYEDGTVVEERIYSSPEALAGDLDFLPAIAKIGDFGDIPDYQVVTDSYSYDAVARVDNSWKIIGKGDSYGLVIMTTKYNRYDETIGYDEYISIFNEHGEISGIEGIALSYREDIKIAITINR